MLAPNTPDRPLTVAQRRGTVVGVAGWAIAATLVCVVAGEVELLALVALPSLLVSLAVGLASVAAIERAVARCGRHSAGARWAQVGILLCALALLLALAGGWAMPRLVASERVRETLRATRSLTGVPPGVAPAVVAVGLACLALAARAARASRR